MPTRRAAAGRWARSGQPVRVWAVVSILLIGLVLVQGRRDDAQSQARLEAIRQGNKQFAFAVNSISCGFQRIGKAQVKSLDGQIARAHAAVVDPKSPPGLVKRNKAAEAVARKARRQAIAFLRDVPVTVPPNYDCRNLKRDSPPTEPRGNE